MSVKVMKMALEVLEHCEPCCVQNPKGFKLWAKVMPLLREELSSHNLSKEKKLNLNLRDYFAAKAMQGLLSDGAAPDVSKEIISIMAYAMADAMLQAREE
jgi:hypothetical protein